jgi:hypothetical protein
MDNMPFDPYAGNILTQGLGPILSPQEMLSQLTFLPPIPGDMRNVPRHIRMHLLMTLRDFHFPSLEGRRLAESIDLMIRPSYRYRDPATAQTWRLISGEPIAHKTPRAPATAAVAVGHSGSGKTEAILRALDCYPSQVIEHESFPNIVGKHLQVVWQSVDVHASGRSVDLAANLMRSWDLTMNRYRPGQPERFAASLAKDRRDGQKMLDEWRQVASSYFLGLLHLDEVQNFFKLQSLETRRKRRNSNSEAMELSIVEDQSLKWVLTLTNTWQIPLLISGTPDGVGALTQRLSNIQRFVTSGYHPFPLYESASDPNFYGGFFQQLVKYQFVLKRLPATLDFAELIIELTAGVPRLIIALWIAAHRVAFERKDDDFRFEDFKRAAGTYLAAVKPAVTALRSKDPKLMARYEDLVPRDDGYWATFWSSVSII